MTRKKKRANENDDGEEEINDRWLAQNYNLTGMALQRLLPWLIG